MITDQGSMNTDHGSGSRINREGTCCNAGILPASGIWPRQAGRLRYGSCPQHHQWPSGGWLPVKEKRKPLAGILENLVMRVKRYLTPAGILLAAFLPASALHAANMTPVYAQIKFEIASGNAAQTATAVRQIASVLRQGTHYNCPTRLRYTWLPLLMAQKDYQAVAKLARLQIVLNPRQTSKLEKFQEFRVQALLAMGKNQAALRNAKSFFDVCSMHRTVQAVLLLAKCLHAQGPGGIRQEAEFQQQELSGERAPAAGHPAHTCAILAAITVNPKPYVAAAKAPGNGDFRALVGKGNLMLLAAQPARARELFNQAYDLAAKKDLPAISERIASSIRAEDGTIGRANQWVLAIRPPNHAARNTRPGH